MPRLRVRFSPGLQRTPGSIHGAGNYCCTDNCPITAVPTIAATRTAHPVPRGHRPAWIFMSAGAPSPAPASLVPLAFNSQASVGSNPTGNNPHNGGLFRHARGLRANFQACRSHSFFVTVCGWRAPSERDANQDSSSGDSATGSTQVASSYGREFGTRLPRFFKILVHAWSRAIIRCSWSNRDRRFLRPLSPATVKSKASLCWAAGSPSIT